LQTNKILILRSRVFSSDPCQNYNQRFPSKVMVDHAKPHRGKSSPLISRRVEAENVARACVPAVQA
jgi:hypothetical protein